MKFRLRGRWNLGPFYVNHSKFQPTSWGIKLGPFSRNFTRGTSSIDVPGPGSVHFGGRKRSSR